MARTMAIPPKFKLNEQQKFLLQMIPSVYEMSRRKHERVPPEVTKAKRLVDSWVNRQSRLDCQHSKRMEALRNKAREAVYFATPEKALAIVRQVQKFKKGCEV